MAYKFNQMIWNNSKDYTLELTQGRSYGEGDWFLTTKGTYNGLHNITYNDACIQLKDQTSFDLNTYYYLSVRVKTKTYQQTGKIYIKDSAQDSSAQDAELYNQLIEDSNIFIIPSVEEGAEPKYVEFHFVFKSIRGRDQIVFVLDRDANSTITHSSEKFEFVEKPEDSSLHEISLKTIANVRDFETNISNFKQIGVQGYPGLEMCIDGELIKVGQTGIYEVNNGYIISFLGFIYNERGNDEGKPFILDYQYTEKGG